VYDVFSRLFDKYPDIDFSFHPHNTHGLAGANVDAAIRAGVTMVDGSVAGLGGCPYAPGASGNFATEDLVDMLESMNIDTGIDFDLLMAAAEFTRDLTGHSDSSTLRVGRLKSCKGCINK